MQQFNQLTIIFIQFIVTMAIKVCNLNFVISFIHKTKPFSQIFLCNLFCFLEI